MTDNNGRGTDGKFLPNNPGKPKGASKNKMRDKIRAFVDSEFENFPLWFAKLKEREKVEAYLNLLPYVVSRLQSIAMTDSDGNDLPNNEYSNLDTWSDQDLRTLIELQSKYKLNGNN